MLKLIFGSNLYPNFDIVETRVRLVHKYVGGS